MIGPSKSLRDSGEEPDYRFTLANERTFLAYVRTALAFLASGTAVLGFFDDVFAHRAFVIVVGAGLYALGLFTAITCYQRWRSLERAMRNDEPLPYSLVPPVMAAAVVVLALVALVAALTA